MKAKTHLSQNKSRGGFTLVEMLVVIGMIAALAGISFPVYKSIQKKVEKQKILMMYSSIERATDDFETEYNYLPYVENTYPVNSPSSYYWGDPSFPRFIGILMGLENTKNFKTIKFLEVEEAVGSGSTAGPGPCGYKNGVVISGESAILFSQYGMHFAAKLDHEMDGDVFCNTLNETVTGKKIIFWTPGEPLWDKTRPGWIKSWEITQ
jgi:prepilin-type N-terminal cleavage/methylation domain-containing protein